MLLFQMIEKQTKQTRKLADCLFRGLSAPAMEASLIILRSHGNCPIVVWIRLKDGVQMIQITCVHCFMQLRPAHQRQGHAQCRPNVV